MKYIKYTFTYSAKAALLSITLVLLACATGDGKLKIVTDPSHQPELVSTLQYIPVQEKDSEGSLLTYEASANPYLSQRSKVDKGSVLRFIEARRAYKSGRHNEARALLSSLTEVDQSLSGPWVMLGDIAVNGDDYQQAIAYYVKAIEINPVNINAYLRLAKVQRLQGHFLHAQNTYAKVLSIWPDFPEAHLNLAVLYDLYLNHPLRAQKHMEAYQFLTGSSNKEVAGWLTEIQQRTGIAPGFQPVAVMSDSLSHVDKR